MGGKSSKLKHESQQRSSDQSKRVKTPNFEAYSNHTASATNGSGVADHVNSVNPAAIAAAIGAAASAPTTGATTRLATTPSASESHRNVSSTATDATMTGASIVVLPHLHTVYCDRRKVVCTAPGAVREGNRFSVLFPHGGVEPPPRGAALVRAAEGVSVTWLRSKGPHPRFRELHSSLAQHGHPAGLPLRSDGGGAVENDHDDGPVHSISTPDGTVEFVPIRRRRASEMFSPPPAHLKVPAPDADPAAAYVVEATALASRMDNASNRAMTASSSALPIPDDSPLFTSSAALRLLRNEASVAASDPFQHHAGLGDVGLYFAARVTLAGGSTVITRPVGPIEPAPPRIRELWIEGRAAVGEDLRARCIYFGGQAGPCLWSWIRIDAEGNRTESEARPARPQDDETAAAAAAAAATAAASTEKGKGKGDPRVLRITKADIGCCFKVSVQPVRWDGVVGELQTSKPTADVIAASAAVAAAPPPPAAPAPPSRSSSNPSSSDVDVAIVSDATPLAPALLPLSSKPTASAQAASEAALPLSPTPPPASRTGSATPKEVNLPSSPSL